MGLLICTLDSMLRITSLLALIALGASAAILMADLKEEFALEAAFLDKIPKAPELPGPDLPKPGLPDVPKVPGKKPPPPPKKKAAAKKPAAKKPAPKKAAPKKAVKKAAKTAKKATKKPA